MSHCNLVRLRVEHLESREVPAQVFTVTTTDDNLLPGMTLGEAISAANSAEGVDQIIFNPRSRPRL